MKLTVTEKNLVNTSYIHFYQNTLNFHLILLPQILPKHVSDTFCKELRHQILQKFYINFSL
jgi:hypothetical protein